MKRITEYTAQCGRCGRGATGYTEEDALLACCGCDQAKITNSHTVSLADAARAYMVELEVEVDTLKREVERLKTEDQARELAAVISKAQAAREDRLRQNLHELVRILPRVMKLIAQMNTTYFPGISPNSYTVNNALERLEKLAEPFGQEE